MEEGKETAHCASHVTEKELDICMSSVSDIPLLTDENFDFDLSLTSTSGNEDEVFVGPVGHKERCVAASIEVKKSVSALDDKLTWSPLQEEKFTEIFQEAHLLALQIEAGNKNEETKKSQSEEQENKTIETFVEDSKSKILRNKNLEVSPRAVRRATYCVQDSPACQLPPCLQKAAQKLLSEAEVPAPPASPNRSPVKIGTSPAKNGNLPLTEEQRNKETNTKATVRLPMAKPSSALGKSSLLTIDKGMYYGVVTSYFIYYDNVEHLQASFFSIASWFWQFFLLLNKLYSLIQPGLRKMTYLKLPGVASGLTRKTTSSSSSSSSVSSMNSCLNSSLPISPIGKKG
ncbi:GTSE1 protein, partial [Climacteris rufus]|nr:GTSE1 protein [Climacteris rufus]